jgi:hypothetical protein
MAKYLWYAHIALIEKFGIHLMRCFTAKIKIEGRRLAVAAEKK